MRAETLKCGLHEFRVSGLAANLVLGESNLHMKCRILMHHRHENMRKINRKLAKMSLEKHGMYASEQHREVKG
jgi:hypothetical protein